MRKRNADIDAMILDSFGDLNPSFAFCLAGTRRVSVNSYDARARRMLLSKGIRYLSRNQAFIFLCCNNLAVDLFFDVGVNYGECLVSVPFDSKMRIVGFEANPKLMPFISSTLEYNRDLQNASVKNLAVGAQDQGFVKFYVNEDYSGKSSVISSGSSGEVEYNIPITTIDNEISFELLPNLLFLKVDVEGFEPAVFRGMTNTISSVSNIICLVEFDSRFIKKGGESPEEFFYSLLETFSVYRFDKSGLVEIKQYTELNPLNESSVIHTDVVLTKFGDGNLGDMFLNDIATISMSDVRRKYFK